MTRLDETTITRLVSELAAGAAGAEAAWEQLKSLGDLVVPYLAAAYSETRRWQGRAALLFYAIRYARHSSAAVELAIRDLEDRSSMFRYRACMVLAYSLRPGALPHLRSLAAHPDACTRADAYAAIDAIESQNHHWFIDRDHTGRSFWEVNPGDAPAWSTRL